MPEVVGVVLAAGLGTRMKSSLPKAVHTLCGKPMVAFPVDLCRALGVERVVVVVRHGADRVRATLGDTVEYVTQDERPGSGAAALSAAERLAGFDGTLLVMQADTPLITRETLSTLLEQHRRAQAAATLLAARLDDPAHYGRVLRRSDGLVARVVEARDAPADVRATREINVGTYCFESRALLSALRQLKPENDQGEYYLTDVVGLLADAGERVETCVVDDPSAGIGINDRVQLAAAEAILRQRVREELMQSGVTMIDPATTYVDVGVQVGPDTVVHPHTFLTGSTVIGRECEIGPGARIAGCRVGDGVRIQSSVLSESEIGNESRIGPFAHVRPGCRVGKKCKIGNFVELKNAQVEEGASIGHHSYIGDASVGARSNIGAGTITCNYDGKRKHRTEIGAGAFVGSNATLVAPVSIGEGAYVAAASVVTQDVPADSLAIARCRQTVKEGWARRRREGG